MTIHHRDRTPCGCVVAVPECSEMLTDFVYCLAVQRFAFELSGVIENQRAVSLLEDQGGLVLIEIWA